jgi:molybdopterin synthase catalytic subunit
MINEKMKKPSPSIDEWLKEAKAKPEALQEGMFLVHNGIVRQTPKAKVRRGIDDGSKVKGMEFSYDAAKVEAAVGETYRMDGIFHVRVWLNEGRLELGDDIMYVLIGGDIRPHVVDALQFLVQKIKSECVIEIEEKDREG